jgi:hypothetical protein
MLDVRQVFEQRRPHSSHLHAGELVTETEMPTSAAESYVGIRRSGDIELVRVSKHLFIPIPGPEPQDDIVALGDPLLAHYRIGDCYTANVGAGRGPAKHFLNRR